MRIICISKDEMLVPILGKVQLPEDSLISVYSESTDPLDIMSAVCSMNPSILIVDDDFLKPNTAHVLKSIRKVNEKVDVIFITSDSSVELGKQIMQLGIKLYSVKPIDEQEISESLKSIVKLKLKSIY